MRFVFCVIISLFSLVSNAADLTGLMQQVKADPQAKLTAQLKQPADTATENFLLAYSHYVLKNKEAALEFSNKALTQDPDPELAARILLMQALTYGVFYRDTALAVEKLNLARAILPADETKTLQALRMDILESFAQAYNQQGNAGLAMQAAAESLELAMAAKDKQRQLDSMIMLGRLHLQNNNLTKAYQHFKFALPLAIEMDDKQAIASISMRLGMAYQKLTQHELALQHFKEAERLYQQLNNQSGQINALINIGDSQLVLKDTAEAKATYDKALDLATLSQDPHMLISAYVSLSELVLEQGDTDQAEQLLLKAHHLASQVSAQSIKSETALFLANVFIKKQNYSAAQKMLDEAATEPEKLATYLKSKHLALSAELAAIAQHWQQAYQLEKSANQLEVAQLSDTSKIQLDSLQSSLELQVQQDKLQQKRITEQKQLKLWLMISLVLLAVALFALLFLFSRQRKSRAGSLMQVAQWRSFTELLLHHHHGKSHGQLLVLMPAQKQAMLNKGPHQVTVDLMPFRALLDHALFWVEQDQEYWLYCASEQEAVDLQHQLLEKIPADYQSHSAVLPLHALLSRRICEQDLDALRELVWYSLYLAQQQGLGGALEFKFHCNQNRPCAWQKDNLRQDLFNAISLNLLNIRANGVSLSEKLQQELAQI